MYIQSVRAKSGYDYEWVGMATSAAFEIASSLLHKLVTVFSCV